MICRYAPPGNVEGQYEDNVLPPAASAPAPATIPGGWALRGTSCLSSVDARFRLCVQVRPLLSVEVSRATVGIIAHGCHCPAPDVVMGPAN